MLKALNAVLAAITIIISFHSPCLAKVKIQYVGNTVVDVFFQNDGQDTRSVLYRNDTPLEPHVGPFRKVFKDKGLAKGKKYTYTMSIFRFDKEKKKWILDAVESAETIITGRIRGVITEDTVWRGGRWELFNSVLVKNGASLTIREGATVTSSNPASPSQISFHPGTSLKIDRAEAHNIDFAKTFGNGEAQAPEAELSGSKLHSVLIENFNLKTFEDNEGKKVKLICGLQGDRNRLVYCKNQLEESYLSLTVTRHPGHLVIENNRLSSLKLSFSEKAALPAPSTRIDIADNELRHLYYHFHPDFQGKIVISGNDISGATTLTREKSHQIPSKGWLIFSKNSLTKQNVTFGGLSISGVTHALIMQNTVTLNDEPEDEGLRLLDGASHNEIRDNHISHCYYGIHFSSTDPGRGIDHNRIHGNTVELNTVNVYVAASLSYNEIFNNSFRFPLRDNARIEGGVTSEQWSIPPRPGANIATGTMIAGNYWSDYTGMDRDGDGIGDSSYRLCKNASVYDTRPLVDPRPFIVNDDGDKPDLDLNDHVPDVSEKEGLQTTLRAAIQQGNHNRGRIRIHFRIPGGKTPVIKPATPLPLIQTPVIINGLSQGSYNRGKVVLDGSGIPGRSNGLYFQEPARTSIVKGMVINGFRDNGISIAADGCHIHNCFLGTDAAGKAAAGNGGAGIAVYRKKNIIGGRAYEGNVISGNGSHGVYFSRRKANENTVSGNIIGLDAQGAHALPNTGCGVYIFGSSGNLIGGFEKKQGNIISGNGKDGVRIKGNHAQKNTVTGNIIGTNPGNKDLGNQRAGVAIEDSENNLIGTDKEKSGNRIAFNKRYGVYVWHATPMKNSIFHNDIFRQMNPIYLDKSRSSTIHGNRISDHDQEAIALNHSDGNTVKNNRIQSKYGSGIICIGANKNRIFNNYINTRLNAYDKDDNQWNIPKEKGANIVGGPFLGGNYWSGYKGTDAKEEDLLGDTKVPHDCGGNITRNGDHHPLMIPKVDLTIKAADITTPRFVDVDVLSTKIQTVRLRSRVRNIGQETAHGVQVGFYAVYKGEKSLVGVTTVNKIESGSQQPVSVSWNPFEWSKKHLRHLKAEAHGNLLKATRDTEDHPNEVVIRVVADEDNRIEEHDETNNTALGLSPILVGVIPDVKISVIRPIQVLELDDRDFEHIPRLPLVQGKPMMTRVWVELFDGGLIDEARDIAMELSYSDKNRTQVLGDIRLFNHGQGNATTTYAPLEAHADDFKAVVHDHNRKIRHLFDYGHEAFNFEYKGAKPQKEGSLAISARLTLDDADVKNNTKQDNFTVMRSTTSTNYINGELRLLFVPVDDRFNTHRRTYREHLAMIKKQVSFIRATYPVSDVVALYDYYQEELDEIPSDPLTVFSVNHPATLFQGHQQLFGTPVFNLPFRLRPYDRIIYLVPSRSLDDDQQGKVYLPPYSCLVLLSEEANLHVGAHEMGHTYGLAGRLGWGEEYTNDQVALYTGDNGWDVLGSTSQYMRFNGNYPEGHKPKNKTSYAPMSLLHPCNYLTFMGEDLIRRPWITRENYIRLMNRMRIPARKSMMPAEKKRLFLISGKLDAAGNRIQWDPFWETDHGSVREMPPGPYTFELINAGGEVLHSFETDIKLALFQGKYGFSFLSEYPENTAGVRVRHHGKEIGTRLASAHPPKAAIQSVERIGNDAVKVDWTVSDTDGDSLTLLAYYCNGQGLCSLLQLPEKEGPSPQGLTFSLRGRSGGAGSRILLTASDGFHTTTALSKPFDTPAPSPEASIVSPGDGGRFTAGQPIYFEAVGYDANDGFCRSENYSWHSSIDGPFATGDIAVVDSLSPGRHTVSVRIKTRDERSASTRLTIEISDSPGPRP